MRAASLLTIPLLLVLGACSMMTGGATPAATSAAVPSSATPGATPESTPESIPESASAPTAVSPPEPSAAETQAASTTPPPSQSSRWGALFVAGDHSITAFDNATRRFYNIMQGKSRTKLRRLTSDPSIAPSAEDIATLATLDESLGYINIPEAENCMVFLTSHGKENGFFLSQHDGSGGVLPPRTLDWLLDRHCGTKPTVVIVSACYSGLFLEEGMEQPNRIILTAARRDRPSFGCGADENYTYYDKCLLDSWLWAYSWRELYDKTNACVAERETEMGVRPSEPQAFFGSGVSDLPMP